MEKHLKAGHYLIAFIDVLGQSNNMLDVRHYPPTKDELNKLDKDLNDNAGYILSLRESFEDYFRNYRKLKGVLDGLSKKQKRVEQRMRHCAAELRGVSDSIIITVPLENKTDHCIPMNGIHATLCGMCEMFVVALAQNKPIRGGIDIGWGTRIDQNEVYGSVLAKAYSLENEIAQYPRIVIGRSLWKYINFVESLKTESVYGARARTIAKECKSLIDKDYDNRWIIDVIGKGAKSTGDRITHEMVKKGYHFIKDFQKRLKQKADNKLSPRYQRLCDYYESRLPIWGIRLISAKAK